VGSRIGQDVYGVDKIFCPHQGSNPGPSNPKELLYRSFSCDTGPLSSLQYVKCTTRVTSVIAVAQPTNRMHDMECGCSKI
jgi:hypothetical protein